MTDSTPAASSNYQPLRWLGSHTDLRREYRDHAYGPYEDHADNLYLIEVTGSTVEVTVARLGKFVDDDAKTFQLPKNASAADVENVVQEGRDYAEELNRVYWAKN